MNDEHRRGAVSLAAKRVMDVVLASLIAGAALPIMAIVAILIKLDTPGPVLFGQMRVGKDGRLFQMWKFRSMVNQLERRKVQRPVVNDRRDNILFKMRTDPRMTRVGRWLRKSSIDELPQLWNVLVGDMSMVGPRPALQEEVSRYAPEHLARLKVKPGLTCIWQVSGRSNLPYETMAAMDLEYVRRQSLWFDLVLLIKTVPAVLSGDGAY